MTKGVDERIEESVLPLFGYVDVERMENDRIVRRVYVMECTGSRSVDRFRKRRIDDAMKNCLKKKKRFECQASKENGA